jgi:uncharacterized membrane protein
MGTSMSKSTQVFKIILSILGLGIFINCISFYLNNFIQHYPFKLLPNFSFLKQSIVIAGFILLVAYVLHRAFKKKHAQ